LFTGSSLFSGVQVEILCRPLSRADLEGNVTTLMSVDDEVIWQQGGLFTRVDSLGGAPHSLLSPVCDLTSSPAHTIFQTQDTTPRHNVSFPIVTGLAQPVEVSKSVLDPIQAIRVWSRQVF
jgi:hypothetical protein